MGNIRLVRASFRRYGLDVLLDGMKEAGIPLGKVIENMCINSLEGDFSMNDWDIKLRRCDLRREFLCEGRDIHRWTMQRGLARIGDYLEEVVEHLAKVTRVLFPDMPTHAYVDGSHVKRNGPKGSGVRYGEGGGTVQLQNQFMVSSMILSGTPLSIEAYPGNYNDPQQYKDFIPQLMFLLRRGSLVVMDNGGSSAEILDEIVSWGNAYLTRVPMNRSDLDAISEHAEDISYVGMGTACLMHTFGSSGRTIYRFFSVDSYLASVRSAERAVKERELEREEAKKVLSGRKRKGLVKTAKNSFFEVVVEGFRIVMTDDPWTDVDPEKELEDAMPPDSGWFKLESSVPMDPILALLIYRHRVDIESMISSIKSVVNLDPLRVWGDDTTRGKLVLALITQFIVSAALYDVEPLREIKLADGLQVETGRRMSPKTFVQELRDYRGILSRYDWGGFRTEDLRDPHTAERIIPVLERYEKEGPLDLSGGEGWRAILPAQWGEIPKNSGNLAMSIEQDFSKSIFWNFKVSGERCRAAFERAKAAESELKERKTERKRPVGRPRSVKRKTVDG